MLFGQKEKENLLKEKEALEAATQELTLSLSVSCALAGSCYCVYFEL